MSVPSLRGTPTYGTPISTGTTVSGVLPTGVVQYDQLYAAVLVLDGANNGNVVSNETGWTEVAVQQSNTSPRFIQRIFTKVAGASESNPTFDLTNSISNNPEAVVAMVAFQGKTTIQAQAVQHDTSSTSTVTVPAVTMSARDTYDWAIVHMSRGNTNATSTPSGWSVLATQNGSFLWSTIFGKSNTGANPAGGTFTMNNGGTFETFHFAVRTDRTPTVKGTNSNMTDATNPIVTLPTHAVGDRIIVMLGLADFFGGGVTPNTPSGWTLAESIAGGRSIWLHTKVAASTSETYSTTFSGNGAAFSAHAWVLTAATIGQHQTSSDSVSDTTWVAPAFTAGPVEDALIITAACCRGDRINGALPSSINSVATGNAIAGWPAMTSCVQSFTGTTTTSENGTVDVSTTHSVLQAAFLPPAELVPVATHLLGGL